jgi:hypothetical protein
MDPGETEILPNRNLTSRVDGVFNGVRANTRSKTTKPACRSKGAAFVPWKNANAPYARGKILDKKLRESENVETIRYFGSRSRV